MIRYLRNSLFVILLLLAYGSRAQVVITTYAGMPGSAGYAGDSGPANAANFASPSDVAVDKIGNLYIADFENNTIRKVDTFGTITTFAGTGFGAGIAPPSGGYTGDNGQATAAELNGPFALVVDKAGNVIFADGYNHAVRMINTAGIITTIAGKNLMGYSGDNGPATDARLNNPVGVALDTSGNLYIADDHNNVIRKVNTSGIITTFAGNTIAGYTGDSGPATAATLDLPLGVAVDSRNNVYIADAQNNVVRKVNTSGIITTYAGGAGGTDTAHGSTGDSGPAINARLYYPTRLVFDPSDNLYISDANNNVVRKVTPEGSIYAFAGTGVQGFSGDGGTPDTAELFLPHGIAINQHGIFYVADRGNEVIRRIGPPIVPNSVQPVPNLKLTGLAVYPNPVRTGILNIKITSDLTEDAMLTVTNVLGQTLQQQTITTNKPATIKMDEPAGIYFISAVSRNGNWKTEVVVE